MSRRQADAARALHRHHQSADQFCGALHAAGIEFGVSESASPTALPGGAFLRHVVVVRVADEDVATFVTLRSAD